MTETKKNTMTEGGDAVIGPRVVHKGNDGIWLNFNPQMRGSVRGGFMRHVRGVTGRPEEQTGPIGEWNIGGSRCQVERLKRILDRFDVVVLNPKGVHPFLLAAQGSLRGGFGHDGHSIHVHAPLIECLGEKEALANARRWANHLMLCLPSQRDVTGCELVSRIDYAEDVLVEKEGQDDYGPAVHEQFTSRLQHPRQAWGTGWEIGRGNADKDRLKLVITSYDKLKERWDKKSLAVLQEYVTGLGNSSLVVEEDSRVLQTNENEER